MNCMNKRCEYEHKGECQLKENRIDKKGVCVDKKPKPEGLKK